MMTFTKKTMFDRVLAAILSLVIVLTVLPAGMISVSAEEPQTDMYATVTTLTGGTVINNGTANVQVLVEKTTLTWVEANALRAEGWWVGIRIDAPAGASENATYKRKSDPAPEVEYGEVKKFADAKDGDNYAGFWFSVSPESLEMAAAESRNLTRMYTFDWDADGVYEQTIEFSVVPSEDIVLLPSPVNYGSVSTITPAVIQNNGTASVTVVIEDVTLEFIEAAHLPQNGYWVGLKMTAPAGFSADATYKTKGSSEGDYGSANLLTPVLDGPDYVEFWFMVTPEALEACANKNSDLTRMYVFDWDGDGTYEQELAFSVRPSEKIILMKDGKQEYPILRSTITFDANEGGSVSVNGDTTGQLVVKQGEKVEVAISADEGYQIATVTVNGNETVVNSASYNIEIDAIEQDLAIAVTFVKLYTVTVNPGADGVVTTDPEGVAGKVTVVNGSQVTIEAKPNTGYHVSSVIINGVEQVVSGDNDSGYSTVLTVDADYEVVITFTINVYTVEAEATQNGEVVVVTPSVEYNGSTEVKIVPADGYTIDTITVGGTPVTSVVKKEDGIYITVSNVTENLKVSVTFKEKAAASLDDVTKDANGVALRKTENLFIVAPAKSITFATAKDGIRLYSDFALLGGGEDVQSVDVLGDTVITAIQLYYQAEGELYADWHDVPMTAITVVEDQEAPTLSMDATKDPTNGYYNSDVTLDVTVEDKIAFSGLASVEYWITLDGVDGPVTSMDQFTAGSATYQGQIVVDAALYNSDNVTVTVQVTDLAGNSDTRKIDLKINSTKPTITLKLDGKQAVGALTGYFETERVLTIIVEDREGTFSAAAVAAGLVITKDGQRVTVAEQDIAWSHSQDGYTHTGTYTFDQEGAYEWSISYVNLAGTQGIIDTQNSDQDIESFTIDWTAPTDLKITYKTPVLEAMLQGITFGFYKASVEVTIEAVDATAGIESLTYSYTVEAGASNINVGNSAEVGAADLTYDGNKATATFTIPAQFRGKISFVAMDKAGHKAELVDGKSIIIDNIAPGVDVEYEKLAASNDKYYNAKRALTIKITEANFFEEDQKDGFLVITVGKILNDGTDESAVVTPTFVKDGDVYTATIEFADDADYTFDIKYTDRSGNVYDKYIEDVFTVDTIAPVIEVTYDNHDARNGDQYKKERKATIKVTEHNFDAKFVEAVITANGEVVSSYADYLKDAANWEHNGDVHTATITFSNDAHYVFDISVTDLAGNANAVPVDTMKFTVDKTLPENLKISYSTPFFYTLWNAITFGFYNKDIPVTVTVEATDATAGIESLAYSYIVEAGASSINTGKSDVLVGEAELTFDGNKAMTSFKIPAQFRGHVSFTAMDRAGNQKTFSDSENLIIVDTIAPGITISYDNNDYTEHDGKIFFKADRTATIEIEEANFFAEDLVDLLDGIDEYLVIEVGTKENFEDEYKITKVRPEFKKNGDVYTAKIAFTENLHYSLDIKYTDRSGNAYEGYEMDEFTIDKIAPVLSISYDSEVVSNGKYYSATRRAWITIDEHNFYAPDIEFGISATDVTGTTAIDLMSHQYEAYIHDQSNWTKNGDRWTISLLLPEEGNYEMHMNYTDLAGNSSKAGIYENFCIDKTAPTGLKATYSTPVLSSLLQAISFGFYKAPVTVTLEATDTYSDIDYFTYTYAVADGASNVNVGKTNVTIESKDITRDGYKSTASFEIPAQFRGHVSFKAVDMANNSEEYTDTETTLVVDNVAPGVTVTYDNNNALNNKYFNAKRTATIKITEANFFENDMIDGFLVITVGKILNDGTDLSGTVMPTFVKDGDVYTATIEFADDADYTFDIKYTDHSGNVYDGYEQDVFTIDTIRPVIKVSYNNNDCRNASYFNAARKATITVTEHNFDAKDFAATLTKDGNLMEAAIAYLSTNANWTHKGDVHTAEVEFDAEGQYSFDVACADLAGNTNVTPVDYGTSAAPVAFIIDKTAPTDAYMMINNVSILRTDNSIIFDRFYGSTVTVKMGADCDISGVASLKYQKVSTASEYMINGTWMDYNDATGIVVHPNEKFIIYFRAEDNAGNVTIVHSTGIIVDDKKPSGETTAPEIGIMPEGTNVHGFYDGNVEVSINVIDPKHSGSSASANGFYSGLNLITYRIYTSDTDAVVEGVLFKLYDTETGAQFDADQLAKAWTGKITIDAAKFNSNNIFVEITAIDNAGNERTTTTAAGQIKIDTTPATVVVEYDNNEGDTSFNDSIYFSTDRTATITVTERNFIPELFVLTIANTDGTIPMIGKWEMLKGTGNGDDTRYVARVVFEADGDYTVAMTGTDAALNTNTDADYGTSLAPNAFTIDKTAPIVEVTYDNNDVAGGNYYKANRVATIKVTEHNFETSRIQVILRATDNGETVAVPVVSEWTSNGDTHTATIIYDKDSRYVFDFEYADKAGNAAADMAEHVFIVDKTNPVLLIEKIVDQSANNDEGNIGFVMTATDTNFDVFTPVLTATVRNGNTFETKRLEIGALADITNGKTFTVDNLEADGIYQITCTLVDKAGNAYSQVILQKANGITYEEARSGNDTLVTFSVNRDGSTFEVDAATKDIVDRYYVQNVTNDIVIVEVNVDPLSTYQISLNGNRLVKDTDYTVVEEGEGTQWKKYTYKINKSLFAEEGEYKLVIYSNDKAGNDAFSDVKEAEVEFVVDRTAPIVTVSGLATDGRYQTDKQTVTLIPTDDGGALYSLIVNLVDANGNVIEELINLVGDELDDQLTLGGGMLRFEVAEGLYQNVQIVCTDRATGETEQTNLSETTYRNISVSSSVFMIFWANVPLRWGTIGGVSAVAIGLAVFFILKKKRKVI